MRKYSLLVCAVIWATTLSAQKKVLNHSVYDTWQSIGEKYISNDGRVIVYTIVPQEGDGFLWIRKYVKDKQRWDTVAIVQRGFQPKITNNAGFVICKIKPLYDQIRQAKIQKSKQENMPKDSMAIINVYSGQITKIPDVQSFSLPEKGDGIFVALIEKSSHKFMPINDSLTIVTQLIKQINSSQKTEDSLKKQLQLIQQKGFGYFTSLNAKPINPTSASNTSSIKTDLYIFHLPDTQAHIIANVQHVAISKTGNALAYDQWVSANDIAVNWYNTQLKTSKTLIQNLHEINALTIDDNDTQLAFVAEKDSSNKALQRFFNLYYYHIGNDSARLIVHRKTKGVPENWSVSQYSNTHFSESSKRLFFGTAPILPPKDTITPSFEQASLDIWHYADEDIMPAQLKNLERTLKKNYLARYDFATDTVVQLANNIFENVMETQKGDGNYFYTYTDTGRRVQKQWQGYTMKDVYVLNPENGQRKKIVGNLKMHMYPSFSGKYLLVYNDIQKKYSCYNADKQQYYTVGNDIAVPLYDETNDVPDDPYNYGIAGFTEQRDAVWLYDRFDIWQVDLSGKLPSHKITEGRKSKMQYRYIYAKNENFINLNKRIWFKLFNEQNKYAGLAVSDPFKSQQQTWQRSTTIKIDTSKFINGIELDKDFNTILFTMEDYCNSPNVYVLQELEHHENNLPVQLTMLNPQQQQYNWGNAALFTWRAYDGKIAEGIVYTPENFSRSQKYPMIVYFYERNNQTLYNYIPPAPTPSRLNISFYVSRGYVVFVPDIWYRKGHPGESAYDYIVSGTRAVVKLGYVDSTKIGIQGQSWGGYQTAYVITRTHLFKAAWAGAPVVNMFSAYGGIRWETGVNRQFQYEKTQSRIGANIWQRPDLYIENSPLFHLKSIQTPLVIMSNDADGAVPWYQGIEFYTAMRRLHKPVWLLVYNGEAHNLVERRNRKDIQIREQQFFDWQLKGDKPAKWLLEGVPAVLKGRDWGLETSE